MEAYNINWTTIKNQNTDLEWIFENAGAFGNGNTIGAYGWLSPRIRCSRDMKGWITRNISADRQPTSFEEKLGIDWKASTTSLPTGRRRVAGTSSNSAERPGSTRGAWCRLPRTAGCGAVVTWHDYEEGTEIQSGIDNCLTITAVVNGSILSWSVPDESTLDHYTAYISVDGQDLMSLGDYYVGTHSLDLSQSNFFRELPGIRQGCRQTERNEQYVRRRPYTVGIQGPPVAVITTPYIRPGMPGRRRT